MFSAAAQALRSWKGAKAIALFATLAYAVGIGSTTAIFTVVNGVLLRPLPYPNGDRFVALFAGDINDPKSRGSSSLRDLAEYRRRATSFDAFGAFRMASFNLTSPGTPQRVDGAAVTPSLAHGIGVTPIVGRWFTDETGAVLSHTLWRRLGAAQDIIGQGVTLNGRRFTVTGIMPPGFALPVGAAGTEGFRSEVWVYLDPNGRGEDQSGKAYFAYGRRRSGITLAQAEQDVQRIAADIARADPVLHRSYTARLDDLHAATISGVRPTLLLLFAAAALLLLITCANVATLLVARSVARARETAIRVALGASRLRLAIFYFAEAVAVSLAGAAAGMALSVALVRSAIAIAPEYMPHAADIALDWRVLSFSLGTVFLASVLSSLAPLWQATRTAPNDVLTAGVRASAGTRARALSQTLVVAEIALAFALLAVSAVLTVHLRNLSRTAPGFAVSDLAIFELTLPDEILSSPGRPAYQRRLVEALEKIPGVSDVAFANGIPLDGCCFGGVIYPEGRAPGAGGAQRNSFVLATPEYIRTLRIPLRAGRVLEESDRHSDELLLVVVNEAAVAAFWPDRNPVGAFGRLNAPDGSRFQIVGVVGDVKNDGIGKPTVPEFYMPSAILGINPMQFFVRSPLPSERLIPEVRRAIQQVDPTLPVHAPTTMNAVLADSLVLERGASLVMAFFAAAAMLMATLGVYGVVAYSVRQRTVEIGTRMALGAIGRDVLRLVVGSGLRMAAYGVAAGGLAAVAAVWLLLRFFDIRDAGLLPFVGSTGVVAVVAAVASLVPAWRATRVSPLVAIRNETGTPLSSVRLGVRDTLAALFPAMSREDKRPAPAAGTLLTEFVAAARRAESFPEALRIALTTLCDRLGARSAWLLEKTAGGEYRCIAASRDAESVGCVLPSDGFLLNRLRSYPYPLPLTRGDFETLLPWSRDHAPRHVAEIETLHGIGARIAVPLRGKGEILGVLLVDAPRGDAYDAEERQLLQNCAEHFALMIENARLTDRVVEQEKLRRDVALAAEVQKRLLPEAPPAASIATLAALSLPARTVGGDYYDFIDAGDHQIGIALADVSGKGVAAALIMSAVQASLRIISSESGVSLPELAERMNRFLYRSTAANRYATFFYAQIDERNRQLRYVNAGHNPPFLLRVSEIQELSTGGAVIGLFPEMNYQEAAVDLRAGDILVAFTDGVTEALNAGEEEFGEQRLKELLCRSATLTAPEIAKKIADELRDWIGDAVQHDDLTFIVMKVS